jgi:hypothetical protein
MDYKNHIFSREYKTELCLTLSQISSLLHLSFLFFPKKKGNYFLVVAFGMGEYIDSKATTYHVLYQTQNWQA